jgi:hypothetical protein
MTISATTQGLKPGICTSTTRPVTPFTGMIIYETDTLLAKVWTGSAWVDYPAGKANVDSPTFTGTVSGITKSMVGLGSVDNTADTAKPVSTATQTALNLKANLASPTFTGTVAASTINSTNYQQGGIAGSIVRYADVGVTFTTTPTAFLVNMPSGCNVYNLINCHPTTGVNNTVTITSMRYGSWSGIQSDTQVQITGSLGNGVHLEQFTVRFYWLA